MRSMDPPMRAVLGFVAGVISVLVFHQGAWALFHLFGLMPPPYPMGPVPPWSVPLTINFCFWGGLYGLVYGLLVPKLTMPPWLSGYWYAGWCLVRRGADQGTSARQRLGAAYHAGGAGHPRDLGHRRRPDHADGHCAHTAAGLTFMTG